MRNTPTTLEELVAPLTEPEFLALLRERKLTLLRGAQDDRFRPLLNWDMLLAMIERGEHPRSLVEFKLAKESVMVPPERWLVRDAASGGNKVDVAKIRAFMQDGFSLIITPIESYVPALTALSDAIRARIAEQIKVGVIVTEGRGGAFKLHYDPEDLIILQIEGSKRWKIYGEPVERPVVGVPMQNHPPGGSPVFNEVLHAGDVLFVPGGNWHHCEGGPGRSLHLGIFLSPPTGFHAMRALTQKLIAEDIFVKPITRVEGADARAALEADLKRRAIEIINEMEFEAFLARWTRPS